MCAMSARRRWARDVRGVRKIIKMIKKMDVERAHLKLFLDIYAPEVDQSQCTFSDSPDLLVQAEKIIGIEHTRFYREEDALATGEQLRPQEKLHFELVTLAHQLFRQQSDILLYLTVLFDSEYKYNRRSIAAAARTLAELIHLFLEQNQLIIESGKFVSFDHWDARNYGLPWPKGVMSCMLSKVEKPKYEFWSPGYAYMVPELQIHHIASIIASKEKRLSEYRARCDEIWLLIVTDIGMPSSHVDVAKVVQNKMWNTRFDKVFVLLYAIAELIELQLLPAQ